MGFIQDIAAQAPVLKRFVEGSHIIQVPFNVGVSYRDSRTMGVDFTLDPLMESMLKIDDNDETIDVSGIYPPYERHTLVGPLEYRGFLLIQGLVLGPDWKSRYTRPDPEHKGMVIIGRPGSMGLTSLPPEWLPPDDAKVFFDATLVDEIQVLQMGAWVGGDGSAHQLDFMYDRETVAGMSDDYLRREVSSTSRESAITAKTWGFAADSRRMRLLQEAAQLEDIQQVRVYANFISSYRSRILATVFTAWRLLQCRNVQQVETSPPYTRAMRRRNDPPPYRYHVLKLKGFSQRQDHKTGLEPEYSVAQHWVRGHPAVYTQERPLFGKYAGTFYIPEHLAGKKKDAFVDKDYELEKV